MNLMVLQKLRVLKLCESYNFQHKTNYKCLMPTNLCRENDNYDENSSHFVAALIKKISQINKKKKIFNFVGDRQGEKRNNACR